MSDIELPPDNPVVELSASLTPTPTPKATPKGKGRGRGRRGAAAKKTVVAASAAPSANATTAPRKAAGGRRGRTKQFDNDNIQANYERQRELKACYSELAQLLKPALIELAERETETLKQDPKYFKKPTEYQEVAEELQSILSRRTRQADANLKLVIDAEHQDHEATMSIIAQTFRNAILDAEEAFQDATIRRLDILEHLYERGMPVNQLDETYHFKGITNEEADNFGPYEVYHNGRIVPYPHRLEGTAAYERNRAMWTQPATSNSVADPAARQQASKVQPKRRAKDQPDGQPVSKKAANSNNAAEMFTPSIAPAKHVQSMMSAQPTAIEPEEPSNESTPVPEGNLLPKEREPALPTHASEPDPYGVRTVNKPMPKGDPEKSGPSNRFVVPNFMNLEPHEIGFRDSTNERTRGATIAKRGKYYETNDSATLHLDPMVARHHAGLLTEDDFDQELVERHQVHPRYGFFLGRSRNDAEPPKEIVAGDKPTVYLTPDGRTIHASRSIAPHRIEVENMDAERQRAMKASLGEFCVNNGITEEEIDTPELQDIRAIKALMEEQRLSAITSEASASTTDRESSESVEFAPANNSSENHNGLLALLEAVSALEAPAPVPAPVQAPAPVAATPVRSITRSYDAIRDMVVEHAAAEPVVPEPMATRPYENTTALDILADVIITGQSQSSRVRDDPYGRNDAPIRQRMSLGLTYDHYEQAVPIPPVDPALQALPNPMESSSLRSTLNPVRENTLPPVEDLAARSDSLHGHSRPSAMENGSIYSHHRQRSGSFLDQPHRSSILQDYPPARPMEMMGVRDSDTRGYHTDSYPSPYGGAPRQAYHTSTRPPPSSRVPFSHPLPITSPSLPPLRPGQPYGESSNGYFSQGSRLSVDASYMHTMQPTPIHPGGGYHALAQGPGPSSQFGAHQLTSPFPPIAPSPSQMHSPTLMPFGHPSMGMELGGPPRGKPDSASSTPNNSKIYRELAPAPLPPHRQGQNQAQELRTINYIPGDNIKDYTPTEQLPARGPQMVRSWNQYSHKNKLNMGQDRRGSN